VREGREKDGKKPSHTTAFKCFSPSGAALRQYRQGSAKSCLYFIIPTWQKERFKFQVWKEGKLKKREIADLLKKK